MLVNKFLMTMIIILDKQLLELIYRWKTLQILTLMDRLDTIKGNACMTSYMCNIIFNPIGHLPSM